MKPHNCFWICSWQVNLAKVVVMVTWLKINVEHMVDSSHKAFASMQAVIRSLEYTSVEYVYTYHKWVYSYENVIM